MKRDPRIHRIPTRNRRGEAVEVEEVRMWLPTASGGRRQVKRRFPTYRAAEKEMNRLLAESHTGTFTPANRKTVKDAVDEWVAAKKGEETKATTQGSYGHAVQPIVDELGDIALQKLTEARIEKFRSDLRAGNLVKPNGKMRPKWKATTTNVTITKLKDILARQVRQKVIQTNPAGHLKNLRVPAGEKYEAATLGADDLDSFFDSIRDDSLEHCWYLALLGLRRGEISGLKWEDADLDEGVLTVHRNRVAVAGGAAESSTKTESSERELPMPPQLVAAMRRAKARQAVDKVKAGPRYRDDGWVAANQKGHPFHPDTLSDRWKDAVENAGIPQVTLHGGRHTAITLLHLEGVPLAIISAWAGHSDSAFTLRRYAHSQKQKLGEAALVWDRIVSSSVSEKKSQDPDSE